MRKILNFLVISFLCNSIGCDDYCSKEEASEINFYFVPYGKYAHITSNQTGADMTAQVYSDVKVRVSTYKCYCGGNKNGPFEDMYNIESSGVLDKLSLGAMEYRMDNKADHMLLEITAICSGEAKLIDKKKFYYWELEPYDEGTINIGIEIYIKYDSNTKKIVEGYPVYSY